MSTSTSTSSSTTTRFTQCEDLTSRTYDDGHVVMEPEFWKCSDENNRGSVCKLQCAIHGLQLVNKATSKDSG